MKYLLDTNLVSDYLRGIDPVVKNIHKAKPSDLAISAVTAMELHYGAARRQSTTLSAAVEAFIAGITICAFDAKTGEQAGLLRASMESKGLAIALADCQIAATAQTMGLTLVSNDADMKRIPKLKVQDWRHKK